MDKRCLLLLCLLCSLCAEVAADESSPALHIAGDNAVLQWQLPASTIDITITVALKTEEKTQPVFYGLTGAANKIDIDKLYKNRTDVLDSLSARTASVSFTLRNVSRADAGRYVCIEGLGNEPIIPDCGQMLVIIGTPADVVVSASSAAVENQNLTLRCNATSTSLPMDHNLPLEVMWLNSAGVRVTNNQEKVELRGVELVVRSVQRHDVGLMFSCRASDGLNVWTDRSAPYTLEPEYGPIKQDIQMERRKAVMDQGQTLQQQCSAVCKPDCTISWERLHVHAQGKSWNELDTPGGLLNFPGVQRDNAGLYRCRAKNDHGTATKSLDVDVRYAPNLKTLDVNGQEGERARITEGQNVSVRCQFDGNPGPVVTWFKGRNEELNLKEDNLNDKAPVIIVDPGNFLTRNIFTSEFFLPSAHCSDTNNYVCKARNELGSGTDGKVRLDVVCMPRNTPGEMALRQMYLAPPGQHFLIKFQVEAFPNPKIKRIISEDEQGHRRLEMEGDNYDVNTESYDYLTNFNLIILKLTPEFFDRIYYLEIENTEGIKTLAFQLREKGAPKPPRNVSVIWTGDSSLRLHWIPGFHGGKPQTFLVQYRDSSEEGMWNSVPTNFEATEDDTPKEMTVVGLKPGSSYNVVVLAMNEYGNRSSASLTVTMLATPAASMDGGAVAGIVIGVLIITIIIVIVLVFIFVIRPKRRKGKKENDTSREPMLAEKETKTDMTTVTFTKEKPSENSTSDSTNNNANTDPSTEPLITDQKPTEGDEKNRNKDGLIYADLELNKSSESPIPVRKDAVNYDTIDFSRKPPLPDPDDIELASDEEEVPSKK